MRIRARKFAVWHGICSYTNETLNEMELNPVIRNFEFDF